MRHFIWRKRLQITWVASYIVILLAPLLMGYLAYQQALVSVREETLKSQRLVLNQIKSIVDNKLEEFDILNNTLILNSGIQKVASTQSKIGPAEILAITHAQKELNRLKISNSYITGIFIYTENNGVMFSEGDKFSNNEQESIITGEFGMTLEQFGDLAASPQARLLSFPSAPDARGVSNRAFYVQTLYSRSQNPKGLVIIQLNYNKLGQMLENSAHLPEEYVAVVNEKGEYLPDSGSVGYKEYLDYRAMGGKPDSVIEQIGGEEYIITHQMSDNMNLRYLSFASTASLLHKVWDVRKYFFIYVSVCLVIGLLLALVFARRNYSPVRKLKELMSPKTGGESSTRENDFTFLEKSVKSIMDENRSFETRLYRQRDALLNHLFIQLLKGRHIKPEQLAASFDSFGVTFPDTDYIVILFLPNIIDLKSSDMEMNTAYFAIRNILHDITVAKRFAHTAEIDGLVACVLCADDDDDCVAAALDFIEKHLRIRLAASVSSGRGLSRISDAYVEAMDGLEYKRLLDLPDSVIYCRDIPDTYRSASFMGSTARQEQELLNALKRGDYGKAENILEELMENWFRINPGSLQLVKIRMAGIVNIMVEAIREVHGVQMLETDEMDAMITNMLGSSSTGELKRQTRAVFHQMSVYSARDRKETLPRWISQVREYIDSNYDQQDLNIASIADHFSMNPSYLSRVFKHHTGCGLLDYFHNLRVERAKSLLAETDNSQEEISQMVGYPDSRSLIRAFKKSMNITPGQYRSAVKCEIANQNTNLAMPETGRF